MALRAAGRSAQIVAATTTTWGPAAAPVVFARRPPRSSSVFAAARLLGVRVDKSHGERAKLTGLWTSKLPQEMVAAMSQGEGDGDIFVAMRAAAKQAMEANASVNKEQIQKEARKEATRDHDR